LNIFLFLLCFLPSEITYQVVTVQEAKSAIVVPSDNGVQVLLQDPKGQSTGFTVTVPEPKKFIRLKAQKDLFNVIQPAQLDDTTWFFSAPQGTYAVTVTQFDPETGIDEHYLKVVVGDGVTEPEPTDPPVPVDPGRMGKLAALAPNDAITAQLLIDLYKSETEPAKVYERRKAIMRERASFANNWNPFIVAFNEEFKTGDYVTNLRQLAAALEARMTTVCINGTCYKSMR
jgi:hypothetical protein